jgi:hypothetical protein
MGCAPVAIQPEILRLALLPCPISHQEPSDYHTCPLLTSPSSIRAPFCMNRSDRWAGIRARFRCEWVRAPEARNELAQTGRSGKAVKRGRAP